MNVIGSLVIAAVLATPAFAQAQSDYPKQQIRILLGFPAGGSTDVLAQETRKKLGQDLIVINKGGTAGALAINEVIASPFDQASTIRLDGSQSLAWKAPGAVWT